MPSTTNCVAFPKPQEPCFSCAKSYTNNASASLVAHPCEKPLGPFVPCTLCAKWGNGCRPIPTSLMDSYRYFAKLPAGELKDAVKATWALNAKFFERKENQKDSTTVQKRPFGSGPGITESPTIPHKRFASNTSSDVKKVYNPFASSHTNVPNILSAQTPMGAFGSAFMSKNGSSEAVTPGFPHNVFATMPQAVAPAFPQNVFATTQSPITSTSPPQGPSTTEYTDLTNTAFIISPSNTPHSHERVTALMSVLAELENKVQQYSNTIHNLRGLLARFPDHSKEAIEKFEASNHISGQIISTVTSVRSTAAKPLHEILSDMSDDDVKALVRLASFARPA